MRTVVRLCCRKVSDYGPVCQTGASDTSVTMRSVLLLARLVCSDVACAELAEVTVLSLDELDALACDCGCSYALLAVSLDAEAVAA